MDTTSEQWRAICEARTVARWTEEQRKAYYEDMMRKRGREAANALIADVNRERRANELPHRD